LFIHSIVLYLFIAFISHSMHSFLFLLHISYINVCISFYVSIRIIYICVCVCVVCGVCAHMHVCDDIYIYVYIRIMFTVSSLYGWVKITIQEYKSVTSSCNSSKFHRYIRESWCIHCKMLFDRHLAEGRYS